MDHRGREKRSMRRAKTFIVQDRRYFGVHLLRRIQRTNAILQSIYVSVQRIVLNPPPKTVLANGAGLPDDPHADPTGLPLLIDRDAFDDEPNDLLSVGWRRCRRMPYEWHVFAEGQDLGTVSIR